MASRITTAVYCALASLLLTACSEKAEAPVVVGTLERDRIELIAEAQEPIVEIAVREGESVEEGQLLVRLDDARRSAQVMRAQRALERTEARLRELVRGPRRERVTEAQARLAAAETTVVVSRQNLDRAKQLLKDEVGTEERVDREQSRYDESLARRDEARASLEALLKGTTVEELDQARATLAEAEAALADLQVGAARLEVVAPRDGQIDALPYEVGEQPPAGAVVVVMLADQAPYARVFVPEPLRAGIWPGSRATVHVDGVERSFSGRVRVISHEATFTPYYALTEHDRSRLSFLAEVDLVEPEARELPTGIPVQLTFDSGGGVAELPEDSNE